MNKENDEGKEYVFFSRRCKKGNTEMLFEVTLSDGSSHIMQAHDRRQLLEALEGVTLTKITPKRWCKACKKEAAMVQNTLCDPCWTRLLEEYRAIWRDVPMTEQELQDLVMSFFVDA